MNMIEYSQLVYIIAHINHKQYGSTLQKSNS